MTSLGHIKPKRFSEKGKSSERVRRKGMGAKAGVYAAPVTPARPPEFQTPFYVYFIVKENEIMAKKFFARTLSVGLSLALCAGMVMPSFAATFTNLQDAIDGNSEWGFAITDENGEGTGRWGYDAKTDAEGNTIYGVEVWNDENGNRNVILNDKVEYDELKDKITSILVNNGTVNVDLNGYTIDGKGKAGSVIIVDGTMDEAKLVINAGERTDEDGNKHVGTITGGNSQPVGAINDGLGGGVYVRNDAVFEMNGGVISNNNAAALGGGIAVAGGSATLNGVTVEGNTASQGGGIFVGDVYTVDKLYDGKLQVNNSVITDNHAANDGGGIAMSEADVKISGTDITENEAIIGGGMSVLGTKIELDDVSITGNNANWGAGIYGLMAAINIKDGSVVANNDAKYAADDIYIVNTDITLSTLEGTGEKLDDGKDITGWYFDAGYRWSHGENGYYNYNEYEGKTVHFSEGYFKAAHDKYFNVSYFDGTGEDGGEQLFQTEVENGKPIPGYSDPTREGYEFTGWLLANGDDVDFEKGVVNGELKLVAQWREAEPESTTSPEPTVSPEPTQSPEPTESPEPSEELPDPDIPLGEEPDDGTEIEDEEIPLAGLFTRADAIGYLWEHTGSPEAELSDFPDVPEDHVWAVAIGWAQDMGIALPDEEGNFRPDDLVLRSTRAVEGELQEFLNRYAVFAGVKLKQGEVFIKLNGLADDIIMGEEAQVIFDDFFAKLEEALAKQAA